MSILYFDVELLCLSIYIKVMWNVSSTYLSNSNNINDNDKIHSSCLNHQQPHASINNNRVNNNGDDVFWSRKWRRLLLLLLLREIENALWPTTKTVERCWLRPKIASSRWATEFVFVVVLFLPLLLLLLLLLVRLLQKTTENKITQSRLVDDELNLRLRCRLSLSLAKYTFPSIARFINAIHELKGPARCRQKHRNTQNFYWWIVKNFFVFISLFRKELGANSAASSHCELSLHNKLTSPESRLTRAHCKKRERQKESLFWRDQKW